MRVVCTIEARLASTRLSRKVLAPILGRSLLERLIERVARASCLDRIVVATTEMPEDVAIADLAAGCGVGCYRGSVNDLIGRLLAAAGEARADHLVALTGDNPLVDPVLIDDVVAFYLDQGMDYVTTTHMHHSPAWGEERTFPVGVSVQVFSVRTLAEVASLIQDPAEREHGSFGIYNRPERYRLAAFRAEGKYAAWRHPELRLTVDTPDDLRLMRAIFEALYPANPAFSTGEAIRLVAGDPALRAINEHVPQRLAYQELERRG